MSDELFEVAFSGQIKAGADLQQVKAKVGAMFKADETKLAHLFSGKRMVIKKNIDQAMANKYKVALDNAGAVCEIKSLSDVAESKPPENKAPVQKVQEQKVQEQKVQEQKVQEQRPPEDKSVDNPVEKAVEQKTALSSAVVSREAAGGIPGAPQTDPLGINANDITDLSVGIAPLGSDMQDGIQAVAEPELDISGLDMAPAGSDLGEIKKADDPPPPSTDGLSLLD